ncbi:MAG: RNA-binding protein [Oscillospiraceae bacterium]|nr:RNA-binding protein [Oscillospiraceae bacterium]
MDDSLLRRAEDLLDRCERTNTVTSTSFLTPAEVLQLSRWAKHRGCALVLTGGVEHTERKVGFFLPDWLAPEDFAPAEELRAVRITHRFGTLSHRDYLGALLALGVKREWLGDILVEDGGATVLCLKSIEAHLLTLEQVGRWGVKTAPVALANVTPPERRVRPVTFTVQSARLDAVTAGLFGLSRTAAAERIRIGDVHLNYELCQRPDAAVQPGDILSLRGSGKAQLTEIGGQSRKGRVFLTGEIWL